MNQRFSTLRFLPAVMLLSLLAAGCGDDDSGNNNAAVMAVPNPRAWYEEHEFTRDPDLRAGPEHVVLLHLEAERRRPGLRTHVIPYRIDETAAYTFCIPEDEPYIRSIELIPETTSTAVDVERGACETLMVDAGLYRMVVSHDGSDVPANGVTAFAYVPRVKSVSEDLQAAPPSASFDTVACQGLPADAGQDRPRSAFQAPNGQWVFSASDASTTLQVHPRTALNNVNNIDLATAGWSTCRDANGAYRFAMRRPDGSSSYMYHENQTINGVIMQTLAAVALNDPYELTDLGDFQFTLDTAQFRYPVFLGSDNLLHWAGSPPAQPTTFTNALTYYPAGVTVPALQPGEVALTHNCGFDTSKGTWVVRASVPNVWDISYTSPFTGEHFALPQFGGLGHPGDSMRLATETVLQMYPNTNYDLLPTTYVGESQSCVWFENPTLSFKIVRARQWIISTNECEYCDLSGADLSGLDLSFGSLYASTLVGANLTNTIYNNTKLGGANFSGSATRLDNANFHNAFIYNTAFRGVDLTRVDMQSDDNHVPQADLSFATLNIDTMAPHHWRHNNMTGVVFTDSHGAVVSSTTSPLDLTGARFSNATMPGIVLTSANLNGADFSGSDLTGADLGAVVAAASSPAKLNRTALIHAYMKNVQLSGSFFRGAVMSPANLGGADLSGAYFEDDGSGNYGPANLAGSYMFNTKLNGAHMANVVLDGVSWYNSNPSSPIATGAGAFLDGASFNLADLPGLDLTGAYLQGASLTNTQLIGANLTGAQLGRNGNTRTNMSTANLRGANLSDANLTYANLQNAAVDAVAEDEVFIEVLKDPDHFQKAAEYQFFAVNRPATNLGAGNSSATTDFATCPSGVTGPCGAITAPPWVAPAPPIEPTDCMATAFDSEGNVIAITCSSSRHPAGG